MASSGITRRIDDLGRLVIPKEMRYNLGIREGEPLELFVSDNSIVIKKYSQIENIKKISENICELINDVFNVDILITDREKIISSSNKLSNLVDSKLGDIHKKLIDNRENYISEVSETMFEIKGYFTIIPIITSIDSTGLICIISENNSKENIKYAKMAQKLIVNKIDIA